MGKLAEIKTKATSSSVEDSSTAFQMRKNVKTARSFLK